jgi:hypothetical protein
MTYVSVISAWILIFALSRARRLIRVFPFPYRALFVRHTGKPGTLSVTDSPSVVLEDLRKSVLKGSDDGVMHFEESCFWTLSIIQ